MRRFNYKRRYLGYIAINGPALYFVNIKKIRKPQNFALNINLKNEY
ncbi:hypothetical protein CSC02_2121 [Enterobacter hormaechei subsp. hoffmannii]|nr:hypothetical protein CSC02_2121 [Enterobacter hormaechei subsp. hoffmannii]